MKSITDRIANLYDRYLKGVCWKQFARTVGTFYTCVVGVLTYIHVAMPIAAYVAAGLSVFAAVIYLIIPKSQEALADNLVADAAANQDKANAIASRLVGIVAPAKAAEGETRDASK